MTITDILQWGAVCVILVFAIVWTIGRIKRSRKDAECDDTCSADCPLASHCNKRPEGK